VQRKLPLIAALLCAALLAGCGDDGGSDPRPLVVATTTQAADLARNVAAGRFRVAEILHPNADPHDFELRPDDVKRLAGANLIVRSGGDVDEWLDDAIDAAGSHAPVLTLADHVARADDDPHWWQDPRNAIRAVAALRTALTAADPAGAGAFARAAAAYDARLARLDAGVRACIARVPAGERTLVTTHDALGYYTRRYGLRVVGAVIPSRSTVAQPSAGEIAALVDTIRREHVHAVFAESSLRPDVEQAIADEAGARIGRPLWADTLGPAGSDGATYIQSIASNTAALVDGLTAGRVECRPQA
jgi:ABC-type Zn uptake system ZnuABC Zn-binding protein ZnuA